MITIGITGCSKWQNYEKWLVSDTVKAINLSWKEKNLGDLKKCDGVVLSGGEDVHPKFYGKPEYLAILDPKEINELRDEFELKLIEETLKNKIPLLGICRGLQIANVYFGGTLIPDLERSPQHGRVKHSKQLGYDQTHKVLVEKDSFLREIIASPPPEGGSWRETGTVNSAHHQAADTIGKELKVTAKAEDGIAEAMEWENPDNKSFLSLVQWHPERMEEQENAFVKNIKNVFLSFCRKK